MNLNTVIALNGDSADDEGFYISLEDIDFAQTYVDKFENKKTILYTKAGNKFEVYGHAYYLLGMNKHKEKQAEVMQVVAEDAAERYNVSLGLSHGD